MTLDKLIKYADERLKKYTIGEHFWYQVNKTYSVKMRVFFEHAALSDDGTEGIDFTIHEVKNNKTCVIEKFSYLLHGHVDRKLSSQSHLKKLFNHPTSKKFEQKIQNVVSKIEKYCKKHNLDEKEFWYEHLKCHTWWCEHCLGPRP